jgi:hypothetical protein
MSYKYAKRLLGLPSIPAEFREEYETLLNDKSYQTQEIFV